MSAPSVGRARGGLPAQRGVLRALPSTGRGLNACSIFPDLQCLGFCICERGALRRRGCVLGVPDCLQILSHPGGHIFCWESGYTCALASPTSTCWGTVFTVEFWAPPLFPSISHQAQKGPRPPTPSHISVSTVGARHCPPPPPPSCCEPRHPGKREAGNLIKSLLHMTWDTVDGSNQKNF